MTTEQERCTCEPKPETFEVFECSHCDNLHLYCPNCDGYIGELANKDEYLAAHPRPHEE